MVVYCSSSDSMEKPTAMEPPDLPPLDIDDLPSKAHDPVPPSINDQLRLDFMVGMGNNSYTRKMVPITGRARSFLLFRCFQKQNREEGETE